MRSKLKTIALWFVVILVIAVLAWFDHDDHRIEGSGTVQSENP